MDDAPLSESGPAELARLRTENAELRLLPRCPDWASIEVQAMGVCSLGAPQRRDRADPEIPQAIPFP